MSKRATKSPADGRIEREREQRVRGVCMSIEMVDRRPVDARLHDGGSAAVFIENVGFNAGKQQGDRRMFGFVEWWSDAPPPKSGLLRYVGDAFFSDPRTALFVHEAVVEKIARDAEAGGR